MSWTSAIWTDPTNAGPAALEELRQAFIERADAVDYAYDSALDSLPADAAFDLTWWQTWEAALDDLIVLYADHTLYPLANPWDWTAMLAYLGDGSRLTLAADAAFTVAWATQQHEVLNALQLHTMLMSYSTGSARGVDGVNDRDWADTLTEFNATAWGSATPGPVGHYAYKESAFFIVKRTRRSFTSTVQAGAAYELLAEVSGDLSEVNTNPNGDFFEDNDHGWSEGLNVVDSGTFATTTYDATFGDPGDATVTEPAAETGRGWRLVGQPYLIITPTFAFTP